MCPWQNLAMNSVFRLVYNSVSSGMITFAFLSKLIKLMSGPTTVPTTVFLGYTLLSKIYQESINVLIIIEIGSLELYTTI